MSSIIRAIVPWPYEWISIAGFFVGILCVCLFSRMNYEIPEKIGKFLPLSFAGSVIFGATSGHMSTIGTIHGSIIGIIVYIAIMCWIWICFKFCDFIEEKNRRSGFN